MKKEKVRDLFLCFLAYGFVGWMYEVLLGIFVFRVGFVNRGFMFGPYLPIYGFGALLFLIPLNKHKYKKSYIGKINMTPVYMFCAVVVLTTVIELITSYIMEYTIGEWLWDYDNYKYQFQGRIALNTSIRFGLGGLVILYGIHPVRDKLITAINNRKMHMITYGLAGVFFIDLVMRAFLGSNFSNATGF